jgi:hypothetical protein
MRRDLFRIDDRLIRRDVEMQGLLVDPSEGAQVGAERRACPFTGVAVDLALTITIIIPGPFVGAVTYAGVGGMAAVIALPFVGVEHRADNRDILRDPVVTSPLGRVIANPEAVLARVPRHHTDKGWAIIGIGAVTLPLISAPPGRISRVRMECAVFPPRSGTARPPQRRCRASGRFARLRSGWLGCAAAGCGAVYATGPIHAPGAPWARPWQPTQQQYQCRWALPRLRGVSPRQQRVAGFAGPATVGRKRPLCTEHAPCSAAAAGASEPVHMQMTL